MFFRDLLRVIRRHPCRRTTTLAQLLHVEKALVVAALAWLEENRYVERQTYGHCTHCLFPCAALRDGASWILTEAGQRFLDESV